MSSNAIDDAVRKAIDLNVRFYSSLGRLTVDYWRELFTAVVEPIRATTPFAHAAAANPMRAAATSSDAAGSKPAAMVIEGEPGSVGVGVFLVENHFNTEIDSNVVASFFKDPSGFVVQPAFTFDPPRVVLKPGEQILVRVSTTISPELALGTRYTGEFVVPGLKGTAIPVVLRSRRRP